MQGHFAIVIMQSNASSIRVYTTKAAAEAAWAGSLPAGHQQLLQGSFSYDHGSLCARGRVFVLDEEDFDVPF